MFQGQGAGRLPLKFPSLGASYSGIGMFGISHNPLSSTGTLAKSVLRASGERKMDDYVPMAGPYTVNPNVGDDPQFDTEPHVYELSEPNLNPSAIDKAPSYQGNFESWFRQMEVFFGAMGVAHLLSQFDFHDLPTTKEEALLMMHQRANRILDKNDMAFFSLVPIYGRQRVLKLRTIELKAIYIWNIIYRSLANTELAPYVQQIPAPNVISLLDLIRKEQVPAEVFSQMCDRDVNLLRV